MSDRGDVLRQAMTETGTSQSELSRLTGVRQPSISQFLSGRTQLSDDMLDRLLSAMGYCLEVVRRPVRVDLDPPRRRSWQLHRQLATHLDSRTFQEWTPRLIGNMERLQLGVRGEPHVGNLRRWSLFIEHGDLSSIRRVMTGLDTDSIQMREVSPMGDLLSQQERSLVLESLGR